MRKPQKSEPPAWLPDWQDASQYPDIKTTTLKQWAWEFLRRNPEYQKQWQETIAPWIKSDGGFDNEAAMKAVERQKFSDPEYRKKWQEFQIKWHQPITDKDRNELIEEFNRLDNIPEYKAASKAFTIMSPTKLLQDRFEFWAPCLLPPSMPSSGLTGYMYFLNNLGSINSYSPPSKLVTKYFPQNLPYEVKSIHSI